LIGLPVDICLFFFAAGFSAVCMANFAFDLAARGLWYIGPRLLIGAAANLKKLCLWSASVLWVL
jgi:uncharacterized membrane protein YfbV (UPF0208 family)